MHKKFMTETVILLSKRTAYY